MRLGDRATCRESLETDAFGAALMPPTLTRAFSLGDETPRIGKLVMPRAACRIDSATYRENLAWANRGRWWW